MSTKKIEIIKSYDIFKKYQKQIEEIRKEFLKDHSYKYLKECEGGDEKAIHVVIINDKKCVATIRMIIDLKENVGYIGRCLQKKTERGKGNGGLLVENIIKEAEKKKLEKVVVESPTKIEFWYENFGFVKKGEEYEDKNKTKMITMEKKLS